ANTTYAISVSSRDGGGNAGTGGPITQTTAADASVGAPVISGFTAEYASPTSALVRWTTDVSSSSFVRWGTNPANLDRTAGDVASSETSHAVLVTGLPAGTTVYVQASATNPCLQTTTVGPDAVVDVDECETPDLCGAGGECFNTVG
ncbi:MAG: hypothetical protein KC635_23865, partial [Myxococcales bacterium]|nr:hypothetical protein [Myxococcales bacterium]